MDSVAARLHAHGIELRHRSRGRVRLHYHPLKGRAHVGRDLHKRLTALPGVHAVEANHETGNVLLHYAPEAARSAEFLLKLTEAFGLTLAGDEADAIGEWEVVLEELANGESGLSFAGIQGLSQVADGLNVRTLVPAALFILGLRSVLISEAVKAPAWYDFMWFSFGTYVALNATSPAPTASASHNGRRPSVRRRRRPGV
jgi:hypothetical protein